MSLIGSFQPAVLFITGKMVVKSVSIYICFENSKLSRHWHLIKWLRLPLPRSHLTVSSLTRIGVKF